MTILYKPVVLYGCLSFRKQRISGMHPGCRWANSLVLYCQFHSRVWGKMLQALGRLLTHAERNITVYIRITSVIRKLNKSKHPKHISVVRVIIGTIEISGFALISSPSTDVWPFISSFLPSVAHCCRNKKLISNQKGLWWDKILQEQAYLIICASFWNWTQDRWGHSSNAVARNWTWCLWSLILEGKCMASFFSFPKGWI